MVTSDIALGGQRVYIYGNGMLGHLRFARGIGSGTPTAARFYYLKDHLGSIRVTLSRSGKVVSHDDYYPYGTIMDGRSMNMGQGDERFKFTGKELDVETGYEYFGARSYDAERGQWPCGDKLSEKKPSLTPYRYSMNNPVTYLDPNGLEERKAREYAQNNLMGLNYGRAFDYGSGKYERISLTQAVCNEIPSIAYKASGYSDYPVTMERQVNWFKSHGWFTTDRTKGQIGDVMFFGDVRDAAGHGSRHEIMVYDVKEENGEIVYKIMGARGGENVSWIRPDYVPFAKMEKWWGKFYGIGSVQKNQAENISVSQPEPWWKQWYNSFFGNGKSALDMWMEMNRKSGN